MLKVESWPIDKLIPYARNPRKNDAQVERMVSAIQEFGFRIPVVARSDGTLVDGHLRLKAAQKLGLKEVPVALADELTDAQVKAFRLLANKSANWAEWDDELLKLELEELKDMDFDLELTGFDLGELDTVFATDGGTEGLTDPDDVPEVQETPVTKEGDIWLLGKHRLMCGDSTDAGSVCLLMQNEKADMVFTDPPYGVSYTEKNEFLNRRGKTMACPTPIENDEKAPEEMHDFWVPAFKNLYDFTHERMCYYITAPQGGDLLLLQSVREAGFMLKHQLIWNKNNHVLGRCDYDYKHEPIVYGWKIGGTHTFHGGGQFKTSVWDIPKPMQSKLHPTMKPVELIENAILDGTANGQMVLDLFGGSGSTLIACEKTGRVCRLMELAPHYCDVIVRRWQDFTGQKAMLESNGKTFNEVADGQA